ncbi:MAG: acyl-CoA dehydrogenase family protein [Acidimicrobiia bacterium]|nr:acyl-CoA dehydrogenase family protein [Acidimicrobiia bacterium]
MTPELEALEEMTRQFCLREIIPHRERYEAQQHVDRELWLKAGAAGLLCASIPTEYGGGGGSVVHDAVILGTPAALGDRSFGNAVHSGIVAHYVAAYGSEELCRRILPQAAAGEMVGAIAMTEPGTGSDLQAITTRAARDGDDYVVNGSKTFITNGFLADFVVVAAKTSEEGGARGISLIVVETADLPGYTVGRNLDKLGQHGQDTVELFFDDVRVPVGNLLGEENTGFVQLMQQLPRERLVLGYFCARAIEHCVDVTVEYAASREVFGQRLADLQNTRFELAACAADAHMARVFADHCVEQFERGLLTNEVASMLKLRASELLCGVADRCLQLHGGYGYMTEYPIGRAWASARVDRIYGGANEIMKELIARGL